MRPLDNCTLQRTERASRPSIPELPSARPAVCHLVSDDPGLDGKDLPLREDVDRAEAFDFVSLLCCVPGRLAFFFDEARTDRPRLLLRRP